VSIVLGTDRQTDRRGYLVDGRGGRRKIMWTDRHRQADKAAAFRDLGSGIRHECSGAGWRWWSLISASLGMVDGLTTLVVDNDCWMSIVMSTGMLVCASMAFRGCADCLQAQKAPGGLLPLTLLMRPTLNRLLRYLQGSKMNLNWSSCWVCVLGLHVNMFARPVDHHRHGNGPTRSLPSPCHIKG
jgi:hypothetical protein